LSVLAALEADSTRWKGSGDLLITIMLFARLPLAAAVAGVGIR
jgi:hypothetical protein